MVQRACPYRVPAPRELASERTDEAGPRFERGDLELLPVLLLAWIATAARVAFAARAHAAFDGELVLAALVLVLAPWLGCAALRRRRAGERSRSPAARSHRAH